MNNARGFMGEPFPSQKFQQTMIDYREGDNRPAEIDSSTAPTGDVIRLGACPPGFKRVEPEVIPKLSWDELYQENLTLKHVLAVSQEEIKRLNVQIQILRYTDIKM